MCYFTTQVFEIRTDTHTQKHCSWLVDKSETKPETEPLIALQVKKRLWLVENWETQSLSGQQVEYTACD